MISDAFKKSLMQMSSDVLFDEEMKKHTSFKIGGAADCFVNASSTEEITKVVSLCKENDIPYFIMGNGSNLLVGDKGIRGVVIKVAEKMSGYEVFGTNMSAQSGILLSKIANAALKNSLSGLEFAAGIPGTLGGGIYMNAGAYGGEMKDVLQSVTYLDDEANIRTIEKDGLCMGYRKSVFSEHNFIILSCVLALKEDTSTNIAERMADFNKRRRDKQPLSMPSAGSTFKRPEGHFAGKLIEDAGLKGFSIGNAQVSAKHSGFIVNTGEATAKDVLDLILYVQNVVQKEFGVLLEPEIKLVGDF
ncbi:MAG: UDP-N-acetylmuramate dehydrogenase [Clostridia bacterium]|nr:UDP-N-acetylmuramate dehydrogenase [Clostridia bacterium]